MAIFIKKQPPARIIALGFAAVILIGTILLMLPVSLKSGKSLRLIESFYTATSAVCVTGLTVVDIADTFTPFGQVVMAALIQIGGLGVASVGVGVMLAMRKRVGTKGRVLVQESSNLTSGRGEIRFVRGVLLTTLVFELFGAIVSFFSFSKRLPPLKALGVSIFHSISAFNNAGFDLLGGFRSLSEYKSDVVLNLLTAFLIFFGGIGFLVISELINKKFSWKKLSMHSKVVISFSAVLIVAGTLLLKLTENITWLEAFFHSVSARTAGFASISIGTLTSSGLFLIIVLMFIGASCGSTGGGVKTNTVFVLLSGIFSSATNRSEKAFGYSVPRDAFRKAAVIVSLGIGVVISGTYLMTVFDPDVAFIDAFFESVSAFGTVGLTTGITTTLSDMSKFVSIALMFIGRLGPLTAATLFYYTKGEAAKFPDGNISVG